MLKTPTTSITGVLVLLSALGIAACGGRSTPVATADDAANQAPPQDVAEATPQPAPGELLIYAFTMGDHTGDDVILHDDGRLTSEAAGRDVGVVHPDGRFTDLQGNLVARLESDGSVILADGTEFAVMITSEGTLRHRERTNLEVQIRPDGSIVGIDSSVQGADAEESFGDVQGYRAEGHATAIFVLALATQLIGGE